MRYQNRVRKVLDSILPELLEIYNKFEVIATGKKKIKDIKDLEYKTNMFVTEEGKMFDKKTKESLIYETLPFIKPLKPMMQPSDLISYILGIANLFFGEENQ